MFRRRRLCRFSSSMNSSFQVIGRGQRRKKLGLYIHIPFCKKKCHYCDFYSKCEMSKADSYIKALVAQTKEYASGADAYVVDSIFIGGGTPSMLKPKHFKKMFAAIFQNFKVSTSAEISVELNPNSVTKRLLKTLKKCNVNRLSFGVQSTHDDELEILGRLHRFEDVKKSYKLARKLGFNNISMDVMYSLPCQTTAKLLETLDDVIALSPEHISLYSLKIEEGTPFHELRDNLHLPSEEVDVDMYFSAIEKLRGEGYQHYEISNFAKPGYQCAHNLKYWNCDEYLGLGPSAASYYGGRRFTVKRDLDAYINAVLKKKDASDIWSEDVDVPLDECYGDYVMLRFRLAEGIVFREFSYRFPGQDFEKLFGERLKPFVDRGLVEKDETGYRLNDKGFYLSNYILSDVLDF